MYIEVINFIFEGKHLVIKVLPSAFILYTFKQYKHILMSANMMTADNK